MAEYLGELYVSRQHAAALARDELRVCAAAEELTRDGRPVRLIRTIFVPEDETCFYLFESRSAKTVREVGTRAAVQFERVTRSWRPHDAGRVAGSPFVIVRKQGGSR